MRNVYLSGPIGGLNFGQCTSWRLYVAAELRETWIECWSPLRGKEYLAQLETISGHGREYAHMSALSRPRGVMTRDHFDTCRADVVFVNLTAATAPSFGTVIEMAWAWDHRIPIVCCIEDEGNIHDHMMINETIGFRTENINEAIHYTRALLLPNASHPERDFNQD